MQRGSGILFHITSFPSAFGIGDFGPEAYKFVDFLHQAKQKYWQILPLNPTDAINYHSPYSCLSAFAGNILFISPETLIEDGWITKNDLKDVPRFLEHKVQYEKVVPFKQKLLDTIYHRVKDKLTQHTDFQKFYEQNKFWLDDFACFVILKNRFEGQAFSHWPPEFRDRDLKALQKFQKEFFVDIQAVKWQQYLFLKQWLSLKEYAHSQGVKIIGDIPIYVNYDSADVWTHPSLFVLDEHKQPKFVAGVPPDYFSETGQRWGNPIYNWEELKNTGYAWWMGRLKHNLVLYDYVRIDHFRGFAGFWQIPAYEKLAVHGEWKKGPGEDFFDTVMKHFTPLESLQSLTGFTRLSIIAEDLGVITPDVTQLMARYRFPGMKVLLFAFGDDIKTNPYIPENFGENCLVYTGTHDNNTAKGWYAHDATLKEKDNLFTYVKRYVTSKEVSRVLVEIAMKSKAKVAIFPLQDILGLGKLARMNTPGTIKGNWQWRLASKILKASVAKQLRDLTELSQRG